MNPNEEDRFHANINVMAQAIQESILQLHRRGYQTVDPNLVEVALTLILTLDKRDLMEGFIKGSHEKCWDSIKTRDEAFFVQNAESIFHFIPMTNVNLFRDLFLTKDSHGNNVISQELKDQIWTLFASLIKISIKFIHRERGPQTIVNGQDITRIYTLNYLPEVNLSRHSYIWEVVLPFPKC
jgi:hypothetical protein